MLHIKKITSTIISITLVVLLTWHDTFAAQSKNDENTIDPKDSGFEITALSGKEIKDFKKFKENLNDFIDSLEENKQYIPVLGSWGSGKSTIANYALGHGLTKGKLKDIKSGKIKLIDINVQLQKTGNQQVVVVTEKKDDKEVVPIGLNSTQICTTFPAIYTYDEQLSFIDFPPLGGVDHAFKTKVPPLISAVQTMNEKNKLSAVFYCIEYSTISNKAHQTKFIEDLGILYKTNLDIQKVHFFITKAEELLENCDENDDVLNSAKDDIIILIENIAEEKETQLTNIKKNHPNNWQTIWQQKTESKQLAILEKILQYKNIHIIDPLDKGESWKKAYQAIQESIKKVTDKKAENTNESDTKENTPPKSNVRDQVVLSNNNTQNIVETNNNNTQSDPENNNNVPDQEKDDNHNPQSDPENNNNTQNDDTTKEVQSANNNTFLIPIAKQENNNPQSDPENINNTQNDDTTKEVQSEQENKNLQSDLENNDETSNTGAETLNTNNTLTGTDSGTLVNPFTSTTPDVSGTNNNNNNTLIVPNDTKKNDDTKSVKEIGNDDNHNPQSDPKNNDKTSNTEAETLNTNNTLTSTTPDVSSTNNNNDNNNNTQIGANTNTNNNDTKQKNISLKVAIPVIVAILGFVVYQAKNLLAKNKDTSVPILPTKTSDSKIGSKENKNDNNTTSGTDTGVGGGNNDKTSDPKIGSGNNNKPSSKKVETAVQPQPNPKNMDNDPSLQQQKTSASGEKTLADKPKKETDPNDIPPTSGTDGKELIPADKTQQQNNNNKKEEINPDNTKTSDTHTGVAGDNKEPTSLWKKFIEGIKRNFNKLKKYLKKKMKNP